MYGNMFVRNMDVVYLSVIVIGIFWVVFVIVIWIYCIVGIGIRIESLIRVRIGVRFLRENVVIRFGVI